jgi:hypothetical protein
LARLNITRAQVLHAVDWKPGYDWLKKSRARLESAYPGQYLLLNVEDSTYAVGKDFEAAYQDYKRRYGPVPKLGYSFLGQQLSAAP